MALSLAVAPGAAQEVLAAEEEYHSDYIYDAPAEPSEAWIMARGGKLYDDWSAALAVDEPEETHPAWPSSNTEQSGATTHRCKSCHGWDYLGADGQYGSGSYQTGIPGIVGASGGDPAEIVAVLRDATHGYTPEILPEDEAGYLAAFVSRGTDDMNSVIDPDTGEVSGDLDHGQAVFQTVCAACHGYLGRALDWGDADEPAFVGTEANANPWEVLHKIRNGHPGHEMIALRAFTLRDAADVLSYARTLPVE
ncbi:MAG: c-type cytochrome [Pseudomonadota bacterium]